jgi:transposase InsO family protein
MRGVTRGQGSTGRMKTHRDRTEFKVTAVKLATTLPAVNLTAGAMQRAIRTRAILTRHGIRPTVNRPQRGQDNAHLASFFHTMKIQWIRGGTFASFAELEAALTACIPFSHRRHRPSGIDYHTPEVYERLRV